MNSSLQQRPLAFTEKLLLGTLQLWNEGQKATHIATPSHYPSSTGISSAPAAPTEVAATECSAVDAAATSRKEEVWGGKPWKSSVVELGGEILCGE